MAIRQLEESVRRLERGVSGLLTRIGLADPAGAIVAFAGTRAPHGWLLCDGSIVNRADYPALFAAIGVTYGAGNGSTTFQLPNAQRRVLAGGMTGDPDFGTLGQKGGHRDIPYHNHYVSPRASDPGHAAYTFAWGANEGNVNIANAVAIAGPGSDNRLFTKQNDWNQTDTAGNPASTTNLPPYLTVNHIIRAR